MRAARAATVLLALALAGSGCVLRSFDDLTRSGPARPAPERCGQCHQAVYAEWSGSAHARAYVDDEYVTFTSNHQFKTCLPCHAPESIYTSGEVRTRAVGREHGVDCVACHLLGDALVGPLPKTAVVSPHRFRQDVAIYRTSAMCGRCHEGTFEQWKGAWAHAPPGVDESRHQCQDCHMPRVVRKVTQPDDALSSVLVRMERLSPQRRHRFDLGVLEGFAGAAELHAFATPKGLVLDVRNDLPHTLPTGDYGRSLVEARLRFRDARGAVILERTLSWSGRLGTAIPAFGSDRRNVPGVPGAARVEITLVRPRDRYSADLVLAREEVSLP